VKTITDGKTEEKEPDKKEEWKIFPDIHGDLIETLQMSRGDYDAYKEVKDLLGGLQKALSAS
jgi:hypothetical protein